MRLDDYPVSKAPADFEAYSAALQTAVRQVLGNAGDENRTIKYVPLAMMSRGYDSSAAAALAARAGCREAISFYDSRAGNPRARTPTTGSSSSGGT